MKRGSEDCKIITREVARRVTILWSVSGKPKFASRLLTNRMQDSRPYKRARSRMDHNLIELSNNSTFNKESTEETEQSSKRPSLSRALGYDMDLQPDVIDTSLVAKEGLKSFQEKLLYLRGAEIELEKAEIEVLRFKAECNALVARIPPPVWTVALDEIPRGAMLPSKRNRNV